MKIDSFCLSLDTFMGLWLEHGWVSAPHHSLSDCLLGVRFSVECHILLVKLAQIIKVSIVHILVHVCLQLYNSKYYSMYTRWMPHQFMWSCDTNIDLLWHMEENYSMNKRKENSRDGQLNVPILYAINIDSHLEIHHYNFKHFIII